MEAAVNNNSHLPEDHLYSRMLNFIKKGFGRAMAVTSALRPQPSMEVEAVGLAVEPMVVTSPLPDPPEESPMDVRPTPSHPQCPDLEPGSEAEMAGENGGADTEGQAATEAAAAEVTSSQSASQPPTTDDPQSALRTDMAASFLQSLSADCPTQLRNPQAQKYWDDFQGTRDELAAVLLYAFNNIVFSGRLPVDLAVTWNNRLVTSAGSTNCMYPSRSRPRYCIVELSSKVCDNPERLRDTLIHELCHVAVWMLDGVPEINNPHGPHWQKWADLANRKLSDLPLINARHQFSVNYKYVYECTRCHHQEGRHTKSLNTKRTYCRECNGRFKLKSQGSECVRRVDSRRASPARPPGPARSCSFSDFVRERYAELKRRTRMKHNDLIRRLKKEYEEMRKTASNSKVEFCFRGLDEAAYQVERTQEAPAENAGCSGEHTEPTPGVPLLEGVPLNPCTGDHASEQIEEGSRLDDQEAEVLDTGELLKAVSQKLLVIQQQQQQQQREKEEDSRAEVGASHQAQSREEERDRQQNAVEGLSDGEEEEEEEEAVEVDNLSIQSQSTFTHDK